MRVRLSMWGDVGGKLFRNYQLDTELYDEVSWMKDKFTTI